MKFLEAVSLRPEFSSVDGKGELAVEIDKVVSQPVRIPVTWDHKCGLHR